MSYNKWQIFTTPNQERMTVFDLKKMLEKYPDNMEIICDRFSDYTFIKKDEWTVVSAVPQEYGAMRSHKTMSEENKKNEKLYLHLEGN